MEIRKLQRQILKLFIPWTLTDFSKNFTHVFYIRLEDDHVMYTNHSDVLLAT